MAYFGNQLPVRVSGTRRAEFQNQNPPSNHSISSQSGMTFASDPTPPVAWQVRLRAGRGAISMLAARQPGLDWDRCFPHIWYGPHRLFGSGMDNRTAGNSLRCTHAYGRGLFCLRPLRTPFDETDNPM